MTDGGDTAAVRVPGGVSAAAPIEHSGDQPEVGVTCSCKCDTCACSEPLGEEVFGPRFARLLVNLDQRIRAAMLTIYAVRRLEAATRRSRRKS